jgi:hypothetical protein
MDNDRAFTVFTLTLMAIIGTLLTTALATGIAVLPFTGVFAH